MKPIDIWRATARAEALGGQPRWRQLAEMALLRLSAGKIQPDEYFNYRLYRRDLALAEKRRYLGYWMWDALYAPNSPDDAAVADSKLASYALFERSGLPHPRVRAIVGYGHDYPGAARLATADDIAAFARTATYPIFIKPDAGSHGLGAKLADGVDDEGLWLRDGSRLTFEALADAARAGAPVPLIVQDAIEPHPDIRRLTGGTAATARLYVLNRPDGASVHSAVLRIPVGRAMIDNFHAGRTGNLIAAIDVGTGRCSAAVAGLGFDYRLADCHPDTGEPIGGLAAPGWADACAIVERAAPLFPGLALQAWDMAFTPDGPTIIEVNAKGEFRILQHALQRGLIDERLREAAKLRPTLGACKARGASERQSDQR